MYRSLFPARVGRALLRVLTSRAGIVRRFLGAFMLAAAVLTVAAAALTPALAGSAQAVSKPPPAVFGIRLVDIPVDEADNPRAYRYIIDHLNPGMTIHRRVQIANLTPSAAHITLYPDAAIIRAGSFVGDAGQTRSDLTTWITLSRHSVSLAPHTRAMVTVTIQVPRTASPGNLYGVIWAQETNLGKTSSGVNVIETNRVGIRIYLNVGPGGPPPVNFDITSIRGTRSAHGQFMVVAQVNNTGGQAIDAAGTLKLTNGPGGLSAGPYKEPGVTLAPGQSAADHGSPQQGDATRFVAGHDRRDKRDHPAKRPGHHRLLPCPAQSPPLPDPGGRAHRPPSPRRRAGRVAYPPQPPILARLRPRPP